MVVRVHSLRVKLVWDSLHYNLDLGRMIQQVRKELHPNADPIAPAAGSSKSNSIPLRLLACVFRLMFHVTSLLFSVSFLWRNTRV